MLLSNYVPHKKSHNLTSPLLSLPQLLLYIATSSEEKHVYNVAGPQGPEKFEGGVAGYEARAFRGCGIFTSTPFEVSDDSESLQMLQRTTQCGEFYRMRSPPIDPGKMLQPNYLDIVIFDEESDMLVHISFEDACNALGLAFDDVKELWGLTGLAASWSDLFEKINPKGKDAVPTFFGKINLVIARPFIEHRMMSAVMTVAGRDTGATLFGPADMQISANTSVKTIEGHYTCHTKSVVTKPENVMVMRDIMCSGYVAGGNTTFFGKQEDGSWGSATETQTRIQQQLNERLTMANGADADYPSMLAFADKYENVGNRDQVISISNRVLPWDTSAGSDYSHFPGGKDNWGKTGVGLGLHTIHYGEDLRSTTNQDFIASSTVNNSLCFIGPHRVFSPWSNTFQELIPGQGHFGPDALPGVRAQFFCKSAFSHTIHSHFHTQLVHFLPRHLPFRMPAGVVANRCRASRRALRWWASRRRRTRSWCSPRRARACKFSKETRQEYG